MDDKLDEGQIVTVDSYLDHRARPATPHFGNLTLLQFVEQYSIPKKIGGGLVCRKKEMVIIVRPYCSPDLEGPKYEQYCRQKLMMHQQVDELQGTCDTHSSAYQKFLKCGNVPLSLADDIHRLESEERGY